MGRSKTTLLFVGLLLASALAVGATSVPSAQEQAEDTGERTPTIAVTGTGEATAEPDQATVHVVVLGSAENSSRAADLVAANASTLRSALQSSDLVADVQSTGYAVRERHGERPREPPGRSESDDSAFLARQTFEIAVENTDDAGRVIDLALANGASEVQGVAFTLSEARHREVRTEAIDRAVADAEHRATAIAASTELSVGAVRSVRSQEQGLRPVRREAAGDAAGTEIDVRDVTVDATVDITYEASQDG